MQRFFLKHTNQRMTRKQSTIIVEPTPVVCLNKTHRLGHTNTETLLGGSGDDDLTDPEVLCDLEDGFKELLESLQSRKRELPSPTVL